MVVKYEEDYGQEFMKSVTAESGKSAPFVLAHLSDPHFFSTIGSRLPDFLNKRLYGYFSWRWRRRHEHDNKVVLAIIEDLRRQHPDHIAVTGDLTQLGLPDEYHRATEFLRALGSPKRVTIIPGNHDAYVASAWERNRALWLPYLMGDGESASGEKDAISFPFVRRRGKVDIIGLSTAQPCLPILAVGSLGKVQLQRLESILVEGGRYGRCRVVLIHHPPLPGIIGWRKRLIDYQAFCQVLQRFGAELVLYGHAHYSACSSLETAAGHISIVGVPSASALGRRPERRAAYNLYCMEYNDQGWQIKFKQRRYSVDNNDFFDRCDWQPLLP